MLHQLIAWDSQLLLWVNQLQGNPLLDNTMVFLSMLANDGYIGIVVAVGLWVFGRHQAKKTAGLIVAGLLLAYGIGVLTLKPWIARPRPFMTIDEVQVLTEASGYSFPSGHALVVGVIAFLIWARHPRWALLVVPLALLVCFSRIYNGVHYPSDVLFGLLIAGAVDAFLVYIQPKLPKLTRLSRSH